MHVELTLLILSLLFFASIFTDKIGYRFGIPALLLFLAVGMIFGPEGLGMLLGSDANALPAAVNIDTAQAIGTIALCIILFSGGLDTKISDIQPVLGPGITLATLGVLLTAVITGVVTYFIFDHMYAKSDVGIWAALLIASTMSSTDSASVFSMLRTNGLRLKHNLRPLLELESGANDPMAYILTITLIGVLVGTGEMSAAGIIRSVVIQLVMGCVIGFGFGKGIVELMKRVRFNNESLYPIMVLTACIFIFAVTYFLAGNPYLAVYIGGLIIGNNKFTKKRHTKNFFEGLTWLSQLVMFLVLGLLVKPHELMSLEVWLPCLIISIVMILFSRPLSVLLCMLPFRKTFHQRDRLLLSWVGLKGAVPIIFAIMCVANKVPNANLLFNVVFLCTIVSLLVQGTTLGAVAKKLNLALPVDEDEKLQYFDIDLPEDIESSAFERVVTEEVLEKGKRLMDQDIPKHTLVIMVRRGENFFVPRGDTELQPGDKLLIISDTNAEKVVQEIEDEEEHILAHWGLQMLHHTSEFARAKVRKLIEQQRARRKKRSSTPDGGAEERM